MMEKSLQMSCPTQNEYHEMAQLRKISPIHENKNAKITCNLGDERFRIAVARLEKDIFERTH